MNPMFNEYKDAGKIQEALLIGRKHRCTRGTNEIK